MKLVTATGARLPRPGASWRRRVLPLLAACAGITALLVAALYALAPDARPLLRSLPRSAARAVVGLVQRAHARSEVTPQRLEIRLADADLARVRTDRDRALAARFANSDANRWVPARIRTWDGTFDAQLRLKGALRDHWTHPTKWSLQVRVRGRDSLAGLRRFSIQHPETRGFLHEWLFVTALRDEGCVAPRVDFVEVLLNGRDLGVFTLEEQPHTVMLEHQRYRDGPLVDFDKSDWIAYWRERSRHARLGYWNPAWFVLAAPVDVRGGNGAARPRALRAEAASRLERFRRGESTASEVFTLDELARLLAVRAVLGSAELDWKDLPFHYDPITARLRPLGREVHYRPRPEEHLWWIHGERDRRDAPFVARLFDDPHLVRRYVQHLDRMSRSEWLHSLVSRHEAELARHTAVLAREFQDPGLDLDELRSIAATVRAELHPAQLVRARVVAREGDRLRLRVGSLTHFPVRLLGVTATPGGGLLAPLDRVVSARKKHDVVVYHDVTVNVPTGAPEELYVEAQVDGLTRRVAAPLAAWQHGERLRGAPAADLAALTALPFLVVDRANREVRCRPGRWTLRAPLVIPEGFRLVGAPGVELDLRDGAYVLARAPVELVGTADAPFVVASSDGTGRGVMVAVGAATQRPSWLEHVVVRGIAGGEAAGWAPPAALAFHGGRVRARGLRIAGCGAAPALDLAYLDFDIADLQVRACTGDGLVLVGARGTLHSAELTDLGGDGLRATNSRVFLTAVAFDQVAGTAATLGEGSRFDLRDGLIHAARVAVDGRQGSDVRLWDTRIDACSFGLVARDAAPAPTRVRATGVRWGDCEQPWLVEEGSVGMQEEVPRPAATTDATAALARGPAARPRPAGVPDGQR